MWGGTLISLYKKEGRTPTRTVRQPDKVSDLQSFNSKGWPRASGTMPSPAGLLSSCQGFIEL